MRLQVADDLHLYTSCDPLYSLIIFERECQYADKDDRTQKATHKPDHDGRLVPGRVVVAQHNLLRGLEPEGVVEPLVERVARDEPRSAFFGVRLVEGREVSPSSEYCNCDTRTLAVTSLTSVDAYPCPCFSGAVHTIPRCIIVSRRSPSTFTTACLNFSPTSLLR